MADAGCEELAEKGNLASIDRIYYFEPSAGRSWSTSIPESVSTSEEVWPKSAASVVQRWYALTLPRLTQSSLP